MDKVMGDCSDTMGPFVEAPGWWRWRGVESNLRSIFRSENTAPQKFIDLEPFSFQTLDHHQFDGQRPIEIENSMDSPVTEKE